MVQKFIRSVDISIESRKFHRYKSPIFLKDIDIVNELVSNIICFHKKTVNTLLVTCMMS